MHSLGTRLWHIMIRWSWKLHRRNWHDDRWRHTGANVATDTPNSGPTEE